MLSPTFLDRAGRLIEVELNERRRQIPIDITRIKSEFSARGTLHSSMCVLKIKELCERELEIRAVVVWKICVRIIQSYGIESETLASDLRKFLKVSLQKSLEELSGTLKSNLPGMMRPEQVSLNEAYDRVIERHDVEIDIFVDGLGRRTDEEQAKAANYNFYGNVGAVQTGPGSSASVVQNLGPEDVDVLKVALAEVREALRAAPELGEQRQRELIEVVDEIETEVEADQPNSVRINSLLLAAATSVQTLASAKPAYQALKGALIPLGITLP